ncbi:MAG: FtsK/SpoIIIE domain-containing protein, partial [Chloroflexota bacterium]
MSQTYYIERPPRLQPELPDGEVEIPAPPEQEQRPAQALLQLIALPAVSVVGALLAAVFGSGRSLLFLVPLGLSVAVTVVLALHARQKAAQHAREAHEAYLQRLLELRREMAAAHDIQRRAAQYSDPAPQLAFLAAQEAFQAAAAGRPVGRGGARLWERRPGDADFAAVRLGTGSGPSRVLYRLKSDTAAPGALQREARRLAADSAFIQGLPVTLALREPPQEDSAGPAGAPAARFALVLIGTQPERVYAFVQALLVQYTAWHAPGDARLYVLGQDAGRAAWRWAARLPHCAAQPGGGPPQALVFEDAADRQGPKEHSRVRAFLRGLRAQLDERLLRAGDPDPAADYRLPQLLLVVDLLQPPLDGSQLRDLEMDPGLSLLIEQGGRLGAAVIFLAPHAGQAPSGCQAVIELVGGAGAPGGETGAAAGFRYAETGADAKRQAGQADLLEDGQALAQFAAHLAPLRTRRSYGADLPRSLGMLEMLGVETAEQLEARLAEAWESSTRPDQAAWAGAPLGVLSGGDIRRLVFSADADGVHGLIAGSTGSGKSELLATLILSLAAAFDPTIVNFVLVDFKGGAAFEPFRNLPHVVDLVTNLHGNAVERMFAAIMAEIHRREALNVASGSKHIVHYRKNGLHLPPYGREVALRGETLRSAPYPHLFVFIDEFAEMIADSPEYKAQLNSITRLGRALGVHLVLAAQRPSGVTDQMRANIKFRIALRVETREESGEVLRRPDAAYLPTGIPGRGYLQVGNENIELIQVAWSGADYTGSRPQQRPAVIWRDRPGRKPAAPAGAA